MKKRLLQRGDVIRLEPGMTVYANVPKDVYFENAKISSKDSPNSETYKAAVSIGKVYHRAEVNKPQLISSVTNAIGRFIAVSSKQVESFIDTLNLDLSAKEYDSSVYAGEYEVIFAVSDGGGDDYPNGWHVHCVKKDDPTVEVDFYQTGYFTAMIPYIEPINNP